MAWVTPNSVASERDRLLGPSVHRVHVVEYGCLPVIQQVRLYAYRFAAADFVAFGPNRHAVVSEHAVRPLGPAEPVGDLLAAHQQAGIELRLARSLWPWWDEVIQSSLGFSGIRLRNAVPRG
jgi:hypothetical protein